MSLSGALEDLPLLDVLQILANNRLSGTLWVTGRHGRANLVLRDGRVFSAATTSSREELGRLLLRARLVSERQLAEALEIQRIAGKRKRVGTILVEMGELAPEALRRLIAEQFAGVLGELLSWRSGHLHFENVPPEERGGEDAGDVLHRHGLEVSQLVLASVGTSDEAGEK